MIFTSFVSIVVAASIDTYTISFYSSTLYYYRCTGIVVWCVLPRVTASPFPGCTYTLYVKRRIPGFQTVKVSRSPFFHARGKEEQRFHETVSKAADTGRGGGSRVLVAWLDRHAALPRDTLLKQRTTLKFSEKYRFSVCKGNKS